MQLLPANLRRSALDAVFPPRCIACGDWLETETLFCAQCEKTLGRIAPPFCARCGTPLENQRVSLCADCRQTSPHFDALRAVWLYERGAREAIHELKYNARTSLAKPLGARLADLISQPPFPREIILVPIPLHSWRRFRRGFNQSELLAREIHRVRSNSTVLPSGLLRRARWTTPQVELDEQQRAQNVKGAFEVDAGILRTLPHWPVVLIDDVATTAATLDECARVLKGAGVPQVFAATLARR